MKVNYTQIPSHHPRAACYWRFTVAIMIGLACSSNIYGATNAVPASNNVLRDTLKNGLQVVIVRNSIAPVVTTVMNYRVGSDETPPGFPGTAHAQEHMMFRGSPGLSAAQLANITAALGGDFDADTQQTITQYFFTAPAEDVDILLHIESIRMQGILDTEELWNQERGAIEQEVAQDLSNPEYDFYVKLLAALFEGTPYAVDALGTRPSFDKTTGAMLKKFHDTWYVPNNAVLIIVGDVQPRKVLDQVRNLFGSIPPGKLPARPEFHFQPVKPKTLKFDTDLPYGLAAIAFRLPGSDSPDYAASQVLADVLSSQRGALYGLVPEGKALFAAFSYDGLPRSGLAYAIGAFPAEANGAALLDQMREIIAAEARNGVSTNLVEAAKRREVTSAELERNSVSGLAMAWSQAVAIEGRQSPEDDINAIRRVTVADVNRVAREYLDTNHAIIAILTPQSSGNPVSSKGFGGKETFAAKQSKGVRPPAWAEAALKRLDVPPSTLTPVVTKLPNGLKLIVQPETVSRTVSVYGRIKSNPALQSPKGQEGVDQALDELFSYGTKSLDRLNFQKALDDIGAQESAGTNFSMQVLADDFERGVQLLADNMLSPALPDEAFKIIQPQLAAAIAGEIQSPSYRARRALKLALFPPEDPVQRQATPASFKSLTIDNIRDYYRRAFRPDLTTIVVIGNVKPDNAVAIITKYFGDWKGIGPKPETLLPPAPPNQPVTTQVPDASRVQDKVTLAETLGLTRTNADYYALQMGNHVLGGAFYATRLYHELREEAGLVYFVESSLAVGQTRSIYSVEYACDPQNVAKARTIVVGTLKAMRTSLVTSDELRQAKALLLREIPLSESSVERIAQGWLSRSISDLPLDEPTLAAHRYVKLTAAQIQAAFAKWLRPDALVQVTQGPPPQ